MTYLSQIQRENFMYKTSRLLIEKLLVVVLIK